MLNTGSAPSIGQRVFDKVFTDSIAEYQTAQARIYASHPGVFMQETTDQASVRTQRLGSIGYFATKSETASVPTDVVRLGTQKESTVIEYSNNLTIPRTVMADDQHNVVSRAIQDFAEVAMISRDRADFGVFRNGFSTQTTADSVALYSNSHSTIKGFTIDNLENSSASDTSVETLINSLRDQKDAAGVVRGYEPSLMICGTSLHKELVVITESELKSGTGNNDLNYYSRLWPGLQVMYSPFLGASEGGSDTAFYLFAKRHGTYRFVRETLWTKLVGWETDNTNAYSYKAGFREVVDTIDPAGTAASTGTV